MNPIHLVILWHMHQPQYRDPSSGRYMLPWTRLHALKDYFGMVHLLEEFPGVHATFNMVPALTQQLEEYASGKFSESWFEAAFTPAESLTPQQKDEILLRAFQVNYDNLLSRWPRFIELFHQARAAGAATAATFNLRDWRDLQTLSQLAWMEEEYLARDPQVAELAAKGADFTEENKATLRAKQIELLGRVLPEYRRAAERGQIELTTTPFYHPILPLLCDTDVARESNPRSPQISPHFAYPEDAREQLERARRNHERLFGTPPAGLWPSEGSVSDAALGIAAELGFRWFASDEGVLGRTIWGGFGRDSGGVPDNAERLYTPWRVSLGGREIAGFFRDHYISDLVGFVYSRMPPAAAAEDFHRRLRAIGERVRPGRTHTISVILDGENAWEYFPGNGREFLREFYRRIQSDPEIVALTGSEALDRAGRLPTISHVVPGSWIQANFDIWAGHAEDVRAWDLLRDAREAFARVQRAAAENPASAPAPEKFAAARESLLAAEGSDWCWWYGPENSSANDAEFDALYRVHLTEVYVALGLQAPEALAQPIKRAPEAAFTEPASSYLRVVVDGRETSYFEWLGAGLYSADRRGGAMHGRAHYLHELRFGFDDDRLFLRVDCLPGSLAALRECAFHIRVKAKEELRVLIQVHDGKLSGFAVERDNVCLLDAAKLVAVAFGTILEVGIARELLPGRPQTALEIGVALWNSGLPVDLLPAEGALSVALGEQQFAWPVE
jgi:alpha-amylase/alpha-mannosidase (GH57 family)